MDYTTANEKLTGRCRNGRKVGNNTYLERRGDDIAVRLHSTDVVTMHPDGSVTLDSGGWRTYTTKDRMRSFVNVYSKSGVWYLPDGSLFYDGVTVRDGVALEPRDPNGPARELAALKKRIRAYAKGFAAAAPELPWPSGGDCWGCCMRAEDDRSAEPMGTDHYLQHLEESYYVPSLLANALVAAGYRQPGVLFTMAQRGQCGDIVRRVVYRYVLGKLSPGVLAAAAA